jgi:predicted AlkP superfamily phosphohydrolase/phosphomutase
MLADIAPARVTYDEIATAAASTPPLSSFLATTRHLDDPEVASLAAGLARNYASDIATLEIIRLLTTEDAPDVVSVYFRGLDLNCHTFWRFMDPESYPYDLSPEAVETFAPAVERSYAVADSLVGEVIGLFRDEAVVVLCSDHGFTGHRGYPGFEGEVAIGTDMHREDGVIFLQGPGIARGASLSDASVLDVTPTVLALLGIPVGRDMDGRPLTEAFDKAFLERQPVTYIDSHETGEDWVPTEPVPSPVDDEIRELLESLGYIN